MHERLQQYDTVAISGMGGIGKTELAVKYARTHLEQKTYPGGVVWLKAREDVASQIVMFARSLPMPQPPDDFELAEKVKFYWRNWQDAKTLVILDDVQDYGAIKSLLPVDPRFKILLTTRLTLQRPIEDFEITVLLEETAIEFLRAIVSDKRLDQDLAISKQICQWLGYLPLGIELVGRYLVRKPDTSLETLWQRLQDKRLEANALKKAAPEMAAELGVTAAFELSWQELNESAQQLAALLSLFALAEIPWTLVEACLPDEDSEALEDRRDESLLNLHLLKRTGQGMYQLHQLLREFFAAKREQMAEKEEMKQSFCQVIAKEAEQIPQDCTRFINEEISSTIPHIVETVKFLTFWLSDEELITPYLGVSRFYIGQADYKQALFWRQECVETAQKKLGFDHPDVAAAFTNLAEVYEAQGQYEEADRLYNGAFYILERVMARYSDKSSIFLGVAAASNGLANLRCRQGHYNEETELLYQNALTIFVQELETNHPLIATGLCNLGNFYRLQGRTSEAESFFLQSLTIREQQLEADHPDILVSLNGLANLYYSQGRYEEAKTLFTKLLNLDRHLLAKDHSRIAVDSNNLAGVYVSQGDYKEAEPLLLQALEIQQRQMGNDHPDVAVTLNNLAVLYCYQQRYREAEALHTRVLKIRELQLGTEHLDVANSLDNLAALYCWQERYTEAEPFYLRAVSILFEKLGADHPNTQMVWRNFLGFLQQVMEAGQTGQLSDHPVTQNLLRQMMEGRGVGDEEMSQ